MYWAIIDLLKAVIMCMNLQRSPHTTLVTDYLSHQAHLWHPLTLAIKLFMSSMVHSNTCSPKRVWH